MQKLVTDPIQVLQKGRLSKADEAKVKDLETRYKNCLQIPDAQQQLKDLRDLAFDAGNLLGPVLATQTEMLRLVEQLKPLLPEMFFIVGKKAKGYQDRFNKGVIDVDVNALTALRDELTNLPEVQEYQKDGPAKAQQAVQSVKALEPEKIKDMPVKDRIDLLQSLRRGGGVKDPDCKEAMQKLFKGMRLEPGFKKVNDQKRLAVLKNLKDATLKEGAIKSKNVKTFQDARDNWATLDDDDKLAVLQQAMEVQRDGMGIKELPPLTPFKEGPKPTGPGKTGYLMGGFVAGPPREIRLNVQAPQFQDDFDDMLDTVIHENTHNNQHELVEQLEAGELQEGTPEYNQALLFQLNGHPQGYIDGGEGYKEQPTEQHAWLAGGEARKLFDPAVDIFAEAALRAIEEEIEELTAKAVAKKARLLLNELAQLKGTLTMAKNGAEGYSMDRMEGELDDFKEQYADDIAALDS